MKKSDHYETSDLWVSAYLLYSHAELVSLHKNGRGETVFVFTDRADCEKLERAYIIGEAQVSARGFVDAFRAVKSAIYRV